MFIQLSAESFALLPISGLQFRTVARYADQYKLGCARAMRCLAICADHGATLCTLDRCLGEAGAALSVTTLLLCRLHLRM